jgi:hypothetical protein
MPLAPKITKLDLAGVYAEFETGTENADGGIVFTIADSPASITVTLLPVNARKIGEALIEHATRLDIPQ